MPSLADAADGAWSKREAELQGDIAREKEAAASLAGLVSGLRNQLAEAKQQLLLLESGSEVSALQFALNDVQQLLRQSEQDRIALLQVRGRGRGSGR